MNQFELKTTPQGTVIHVQASTRPGLLTAILKGILAAQAVIKDEEDPLIERPFSLEAEEFPDLMKKYVMHLLGASAEHQEAYEDMRLTFATDRKVEGVILGRHADAFAHQFSGLQSEGFDIERTIEGPWKAVVPLWT